MILSDFNPAWDTLRRVAHVAIRKYAATDKLASVCSTFVEGTVDELPDNANAKIELVSFMEDIMSNVVAISAFGERLVLVLIK